MRWFTIKLSLVPMLLLAIFMNSAPAKADITKTWGLNVVVGSVGFYMKETIQAGQSFRVGVQTHYGSSSWTVFVLDPDGEYIGATEFIGGVIYLVAPKTGQYRIRLTVATTKTATGVSGYYIIEDGTGTPPPPVSGPAAVPSMYPANTQSLLPFYVAWNHVAKAQWYDLWILGPSGFLHHQWYPATNADGNPYGQNGVCLNVICAVYAPAFLYNGRYEMWIGAWGSSVMGPYNTQAFTFDLQIPSPGEVLTVTPLQDESVSAASTNLSWAYEPGVHWYHVYVIITETGQVLDMWFPATANDGAFYNQQGICTETYCGVNLTGNTRGLVQWWVGAWNPGGMVYTAENRFTFSELPSTRQANILLPLYTGTEAD